MLSTGNGHVRDVSHARRLTCPLPCPNSLQDQDQTVARVWLGLMKSGQRSRSPPGSSVARSEGKRTIQLEGWVIKSKLISKAVALAFSRFLKVPRAVALGILKTLRNFSTNSGKLVTCAIYVFIGVSFLHQVGGTGGRRRPSCRERCRRGPS